LPELHRRTAQPGKLIGNAVGVLGRQQQVANSRTLALGQLSCALCQHTAGNTAGENTQPGNPGPPSAPNGRGTCVSFAALIVEHVASLSI